MLSARFHTTSSHLDTWARSDYVVPPRFRDESHCYEEIYNNFVAEVVARTDQPLWHDASLNPPSFTLNLPMPIDDAFNTASHIPVSIQSATVPIASPKPIYAWSHIPAIEQVAELLSSSAPFSMKLPGQHLEDMNMLDGVVGHVGIVEHGPKLASGCYADVITAYTYTAPTGQDHHMDNYYYDRQVAKETANMAQVETDGGSEACTNVQVCIEDSEAVEGSPNECVNDMYRTSVWQVLEDLLRDVTAALDNASLGEVARL